MDVVAIISAVVAIAGVLFGLLSWLRNRTADDHQDGKQSGTVLTELGYIKSGVDDIKRKQEKQEEQHIGVVTRLTAVEESAKQAHKRIGTLEDRLNQK